MGPRSRLSNDGTKEYGEVVVLVNARSRLLDGTKELQDRPNCHGQILAKLVVLV